MTTLTWIGRTSLGAALALCLGACPADDGTEPDTDDGEETAPTTDEDGSEDTTEGSSDTDGETETTEGETTESETTEGETTDGETETTEGETTEGETTEGETTESETGEGSSFAEVVWPIFEANSCTSPYCHGSAAANLDFGDVEAGYAALVGVAAEVQACDASERVVEGAPEDSVLWLRVRPSALDEGMECAPKMPQGSEGLSEADAQIIEDWIAGGALP